MKVSITIIGGGVIGCAVAYEIAKTADKEIVLIEKNSKIPGENQSSRNSGVIHAGIFYPRKSGPLKARLCIEGNRMLYKFCEEYGIPYKKTGKLVVATDLREEEYLEDVLAIAEDNDVPGIKQIDGKEIRKYEPNVKGITALYVPTSGIIDGPELVKKLYKLAESYGVIFLTGNEAVGVTAKEECFTLTIKSRDCTETFDTEILVNTAGLYSDEIAKMINSDSLYRMDPVKGESAKFYKTKRKDIFTSGMNVYPVPHGYLPSGEKLEVSFKEFKRLFKEGKITKSVGVHITPTFDIIENKYEVGETVTIGPAYAEPDGKEDYKHTRHEEYYLNTVKSFFPNLKLEDIGLHQVGLRARLKDYYDFVIEKDSKFPNCVNIIGIDSPGLTASLAIAKYAKELIKE